MAPISPGPSEQKALPPSKSIRPSRYLTYQNRALAVEQACTALWAAHHEPKQELRFLQLLQTFPKSAVSMVLDNRLAKATRLEVAEFLPELLSEHEAADPSAPSTSIKDGARALRRPSAAAKDPASDDEESLAKRAIDRIRACDDAAVRLAFVEGLRSLGPDAVAWTIQFFDDPDPVVASRARSSIGAVRVSTGRVSLTDRYL